MLKFTILLILFGVGSTAAYELSREQEPAQNTPVRTARSPGPLKPVGQQPQQTPPRSDGHIVSIQYAALFPDYSFQSAPVPWWPECYPNGVSVTTTGPIIPPMNPAPDGTLHPCPHFQNPGWVLLSSDGTNGTWQHMSPHHVAKTNP